MISPAQNTPLSVSELTAHIKQVLEQGFARVQVIGEVSRLTARASGHAYFTIKDANAALGAVIWKSTAVRLSALPEEGRQYIFHGHLSLYPPQGRYQLVVSRLEAVGGGALAAEFERRKQDFSARGWFDASRKQPVPPLPRHIGIVTSETTAALQDVRKVLATRPGWLRLTLAPTPVQGQSAPKGIVRALRRLQDMANPPDVILLVRGGGSPEDLWCFNDEGVIRAMVDCPIPLISGIGHDIDLSLADLAVDLHAATPSNAAELCCPSSESLHRQMPRIPLLRQMVSQRLAHDRRAGEQAATRLVHRMRLWRDEQRMRIERSHGLLGEHYRQFLADHRRKLLHIERRLAPLEPGHRLRMRQRRLDDCMQRLSAAATGDIRHASRRLEHAQQTFRQMQMSYMVPLRQHIRLQQARLSDLGPQAVLQRGYALPLDIHGRLVRSARDLHAGDEMQIVLHDGCADTRVQKVDKR